MSARKKQERKDVNSAHLNLNKALAYLERLRGRVIPGNEGLLIGAITELSGAIEKIYGPPRDKLFPAFDEGELKKFVETPPTWKESRIAAQERDNPFRVYSLKKLDVSAFEEESPNLLAMIRPVEMGPPKPRGEPIVISDNELFAPQEQEEMIEVKYSEIPMIKPRPPLEHPNAAYDPFSKDYMEDF